MASFGHVSHITILGYTVIEFQEGRRTKVYFDRKPVNVMLKLEKITVGNNISRNPYMLYFVNISQQAVQSKKRICSRLTTVNFEHVSHLVLMFLLLTLSREIPTGFSILNLWKGDRRSHICITKTVRYFHIFPSHF